eukprot:gnl/MRDRNA2_/MRDRNA2_108271_c0_seq1.p1 gnl/MRDRNA2_/MRDRNA2_108271_c0~~gnl/MRDRNA2_/MRDRNA2_108271_c0_seq1.p1  ORF type:complete len:1013 (+),score=221.06 gnl/MRDRNA2_/MRDRNA2_108271_c0_seq1:72-3110(+)
MQLNANRFVSLHDVRGAEKRSESAGANMLGMSSQRAHDKTSGRSPGGGGSRNGVLEELLGGRERAAKQARPSTAERIRSFETHNEANELAQRVQKERQSAALHDLALCKLDALRIVETELDLNFQSIKEFRRKVPPTAGHGITETGKSRGSTSGKVTNDVQELHVQLELEGPAYGSSRAKKGGSQGLVLYATSPFAVRQCSYDKKFGPAVAWKCPPGYNKSQSPGLMRDLLSVSAGGVTTQSKEQKDGSHHLRVDLRERMPESLVFKQEVDDSQIHNASYPERDGHLNQVEAQCDLLEKNLEEQLQEHLAELSARLVAGGDPVQDNTAQTSDSDNRDNSGLGGHKGKGAAGVEKAKVYLRSFRTVLRLLGPLIPTAASVLEGSLKGTLLAIDAELTAAWQAKAALEEQVSRRASDDFASDVLKRQIRQMNQKNDELKANLQECQKKFKAESTALQEKIAELTDEIVHLSPNHSDLEGVGGLMNEFGNLMGEMEEECARQGRILQDMGNYALRIIQKKDEDPSKHRSRGRCIELPNGEIELRLYDTEDAHVGVTEDELCPTDQNSAIRLRTLKVRQCFAKFSSKVMSTMRIQDLCAEIDKIYAAKMTADVEADSAGVPRAQLLDFIVHFYLDQLHYVSLAEKQLYSILSCIHRHSGQQVPLKVELFARFLEFAELDRVLPLSVLNIALRAKRNAQAYIQRAGPKDSSGAKKTGAMVGDGTLAVAAAYEAAARTLPDMGTLGFKELFQGLSKHSEIEGIESKREGVREFIVLVLLLHDKLKKDAAPMLRDLIYRIEQSSTRSTDATFDDFREALRDCHIYGVDDNIWKPKLAVPGMPNAISADVLLETLGGGSLSRLPKASITETGFMAVVTDSVASGFVDSTKLLKQVWETQRATSATPHGAMRYADFKVLTQSVEPNLTDPEIKRFFVSAIEVSHACTQTAGALCPITGSVDSVNDTYGGDTISFTVMLQAALRCRLFLQDGMGGEGGHQMRGLPQQSPRDSQAQPKKKGKR